MYCSHFNDNPGPGFSTEPIFSLRNDGVKSVALLLVDDVVRTSASLLLVLVHLSDS